jgi:predicted nucleic acid-binding protein
MALLPSGDLLFDTVVYIRFTRSENYSWLADTRVFRRTILTAVVAAELYAGTSNRAEKLYLDDLCRMHRVAGTFSVPTAAAWMHTGILLRRARRVFGEMPFVAHFRDLLIALEAARLKATLVTENARDFLRWRSVLASTGTTLSVFDPSHS